MPKETSRPATTWLSTPGRSYLLPGVRRSNATSSELIRIIEYNFKYHYIKHKKCFTLRSPYYLCLRLFATRMQAAKDNVVWQAIPSISIKLQ